MTLMSQRFVRGFWLDGNDIERVEKLVADAQSIAPAAAVSLMAAGLLYEVEGRFQEAMATAQRLIHGNPNYTGGYISLARNKIYIGQADQAIPLLTKAIQLNPRSPSLADHRTIPRINRLAGARARSLSRHPCDLPCLPLSDDGCRACPEWPNGRSPSCNV